MHLVLVDCKEALAEVRAQPHGLIATEDPYLAACEDGVVNLDALLPPEAARILGRWSTSCADALDHCVRPFFPGSVSIARPAGVLVASLLYRAAVLQQALQYHQPTRVTVYTQSQWTMSGQTSPFSPPRFASPAGNLLREGFAGTGIALEERLVVTNDTRNVNDTALSSLMGRIFAMPGWLPAAMVAERMLGRLLGRYGRVLPVLGSDDGLLREAGLPLVLSRFRLKRLPTIAKLVQDHLKRAPVGSADRIDGAAIRAAMEEGLPTQLPDVLAPYFPLPAWASVRRLAVGALTQGAMQLLDMLTVVDAVSDKLAAEAEAGFCVAFALSSPFAGRLHENLGRLGVSLIGVEHGLTKGLSRATRERPHVSEYYNCDRFLAYSDMPKADFPEEKDGRRSAVIAVGAPDQVRYMAFPRLQRIWAKRHLNIPGNTECVYHVSPFPPGGNMRLGEATPSESLLLETDRQLVNGVYNRLGRTVLFKPYPSLRFPYRPDYAKALGFKENVRLVAEADFRYTRAVADILVSGTPTSTLGWCLGTGKPLIWLDAPHFPQLVDDALREELSQSVFYINIAGDEGLKRMQDLLSLPLADIQAEWLRRAPAREAMLTRFGFRMQGRAGWRVARTLSCLAR